VVIMRGRVLVLAALLSTSMAFVVGAQTGVLVSGEVTKVDEAKGMVTIKHGPVPSLGLNSAEASDDFKAKEPLMLFAVRPGENIKFTADREDGQLTIMALETAKR
jgi:Cu/Ag efflux protein CusF